MPVSLERREAQLAVNILLISLAIRVLLSPIPGYYSVDLSTFSAWFKTTAEHGPRVFYEATSFSDYPSFNVYIFWVFGSLASPFRARVAGYGGYPFTSIHAFNVWAFHGFWKPDRGRLLFLDFFTVGWLMFGALTVFTLYHLSKGIDDKRDPRVLSTAFVLLFGFFMLPTRIHERYLFPVFSVLSMARALALSLRQAVSPDSRRKGVPSSKGVIG